MLGTGHPMPASPSSSGGQNKPMKLRCDGDMCLGGHDALSCVTGIIRFSLYFQTVSLCSPYQCPGAAGMNRHKQAENTRNIFAHGAGGQSEIIGPHSSGGCEGEPFLPLPAPGILWVVAASPQSLPLRLCGFASCVSVPFSPVLDPMTSHPDIHN